MRSRNAATSEKAPHGLIYISSNAVVYPEGEVERFVSECRTARHAFRRRSCSAGDAAERIRVADTNDPAATPDELVPDAGRGKLLAATLTSFPEKPVGTMELFFNVNAMDDFAADLNWKCQD